MSSPDKKETILSPPVKQKRALPQVPVNKSPSSEQSPNIIIQPQANRIEVVTIQANQSVYGKLPTKRENVQRKTEIEEQESLPNDPIIPKSEPIEVKNHPLPSEPEKVVSSSPPQKGKVPYGKIPITQIQERIKLNELRSSQDKEKESNLNSDEIENENNEPPTPPEMEEKPPTPPTEPSPIQEIKPSPVVYGKLPSRADMLKAKQQAEQTNDARRNSSEKQPSFNPQNSQSSSNSQSSFNPQNSQSSFNSQSSSNSQSSFNSQTSFTAQQNVPEKKTGGDHYAKIPQIRFSRDKDEIPTPQEPEAKKTSNDGSHYASIPKIQRTSSAQSTSLSEFPTTKTYKPPTSNESTSQKHYQSIPKIFSDEEAKKKQMSERLEQMRQNEETKSGSAEKPLVFIRTTVDDLTLREKKQNLMLSSPSSSSSSTDRGRASIRVKSMRSGSAEPVVRDESDRNSKKLVRRLSARILGKLDSLKMSRKLSALDPEEKDNLAKFMTDYPHLFEEEKNFIRADYFLINIHDQVDSTKSTLYEMSVQKVKNLTKNKDYYVFLFSDVMVLTRKKPYKGLDFKLKSKLPLQHCRLIMVGDDEKHKNSFQLAYVNTTYTMTPKRNHEEIKNTWFKDIKGEIKKFQKEKAEQQKRIQDDRRSSIITQPIVQNSKSEDFNAKMVSILEDDNLAQYFREFLHQEYNNENFSFWLEVEDFRRHTPDWSIPVRAEEIFNNYLKSEAPKEVNIDSQSKNEILKIMKSSDNITRNIFDQAQRQIFSLMATDCVPRFYKSQLYQDYQADLQGGKKRFIQRSDTQVMLRHYVMEKKKEEEKK